MKLHFQKLLFALSLPLLLCSFLIPASSYALAPIDQECGTEGQTRGLVGYMGIFGSLPDYQVFVPTRNTLDAVTVRVRGLEGSVPVKLEVIDALTPPYRTIASQRKTIDTTERWITFDFPDVAMPRSGYVIALSGMLHDDRIFLWKYRTENCYDRGYATVNGEYRPDIDFGFAVYSYDTVAPNNPGSGNQPGGQNPPTNPPTGGSSGSTSGTSPLGTSAGSGNAPASQTSSGILPPTGLTAKDTDLDYGGAIDLSWKASTSTNIDGYKLFRRAEGDNQYVEILRLPKTFVKFTDPWATKDKTYYYKIRSYKGSGESADSNIATATSKDNMTGITKDILDDYKKNGGNSGVLGEAGFMIIIPIVIILLIIGLFILGLWVLLHKRKPKMPPQPSEIKVTKEIKR